MISDRDVELNFHNHFEVFIQRAMRQIMGTVMQEGLSIAQIYALLYLYHEGDARVVDIAQTMNEGKAAASQLVERLVKRGLVERVEDESDRRARKIRLLPRSRELIELGLAAHRQLMDDLMKKLTRRQREVVKTAFEYLMEAVHKP